MTEDTKRALEIIEPMAKELHIRAQADDEFLYCDGQAIGISCNSTYATVMEFIGYLIFLWSKDKSEPVPKAMASRIKRYWFTEEQLQMFRKEMGK